MRYAVVYRDETDRWIAEVPSLPGCISQGETRDAVIQNIGEAIALYLENMNADQAELYADYIEPELIAIDWIAGESSPARIQS